MVAYIRQASYPARVTGIGVAKIKHILMFDIWFELVLSVARNAIGLGASTNYILSAFT